MLIVIELILILVLVSYIGFSTNENGVLEIFNTAIQPVILGLVFMLVGILITLPILLRDRVSYMGKVRRANREIKDLKKILEGKRVKEADMSSKESRKELNNKKLSSLIGYDEGVVGREFGGGGSEESGEEKGKVKPE